MYFLLFFAALRPAAVAPSLSDGSPAPGAAGSSRQHAADVSG